MNESVPFLGSQVAKLVWKTLLIGVLVLIVAGYFRQTIVGKEIFAILILFYFSLSITRIFLYGETIRMSAFDVLPSKRAQRVFYFLSSFIFLFGGIQMVFD